ncbi:MAG: 2-amino-4-hydroxy-6-hydroxymethyldihydropteridine diphosphokinase [Myxococcales bacterium]|nr:2-amino-4-hydroxy-6-hydroxymethyldihydropteridine diphosphokinase [Myxococcales bacterium]MCB9578969.1 2-amino-4-hydroxy-6-hydroxymethyldihydropteridine diphosphokinase [Polyangiaceae bacterium]
MLRYVIGLGSNLGDRLARLRAGVQGCAENGTIVAVSTLFETDPVGGPKQGPYLNAALRLDSELSPETLLDALLAVERRQGRERRVRWGPRTLDLDLLWSPGLQRSVAPSLPHPRLAERGFALIPLLEVAPDARDPGSGRPYAELLPGQPLEGLRRVPAPTPWCPDFPHEIEVFQGL